MYFGGYFGLAEGDAGAGPVYPVIANAATAESIRDRIYAVIEALTPTSLTADKFRRYRNEDGADFESWAEGKVTAAFRRFQVRETGDDIGPLISNTLSETVDLELSIRIAYPQTHRYGAANGMDRDDVINQDWLKINAAVGIYGRSNFTGSYDCTPIGAAKAPDRGTKVDYLVVTARFQYQRAVT
jgi:hypothetical protein